MPTRLTCPNGHEWHADAWPGPTPCPVCGAAVDVAPETATLPPQPTPSDTPTAEFPGGADFGIHGDPTLPSSSSGPGAQSAKFPAIPGYELMDVLGRGGMGVVYKARQQSLNRIVALKMILAGGHATHAELARFRAEAEAAANLSHPNIVQIYDIQTEGSPYFSLEFVEGGSLAQRIGEFRLPTGDKSDSALSWSKIEVESRLRKLAGLVETLARAMHYAHQRGIIHRDLKPANVQLTPDGTPKITDFGLAKRLDLKAGHTQTGAIMGTPGYMSPEQAAGKSKEIGPAADIHALGVILYELLTGRPPFTGDTPIHVAMRVAHEDPAPPSRFQPRTPRDLETICMKCLEKDPRKRYASAEALADDLRRFQMNEPITARPSGIIERTFRAVKRRKEIALVLSGAAATIVILAVLGRRPSSEPGPAFPPKPIVEQNLEPLPADLALVPRDALGFLSVRVADVLRTEGVKRLEQWAVKEAGALFPASADWQAEIQKELGLRPDQVERVTVVALSAQSGSLVAVLSATQDIDRSLLLKGLNLGGREGLYHNRAVYTPEKTDQWAVHFMSRRVVVVAQTPSALLSFLDRLPASDADGPLREALGLAAKDSHAVLGVNPAAFNLKTLAATLPEPYAAMRPLTEIESVAVLMRLKSTARTRDFGDLLQVDLRLAFRDDDGAKRGSESASAAVTLLHKDVSHLVKQFRSGWEDLVKPGPAKGLANVDKLTSEVLEEVALALESAQIDHKQRTVHVLLNVRTDLPTLSGFRAREAARRVQVGNQLARLHQALSDFEKEHGHYPPPAVTAKNGTPLLSWRVQILPYLGAEEAKLYRDFRLDEPWSGPHNLRLLPRMPKVFAPGSGAGGQAALPFGLVGLAEVFSEPGGGRSAFTLLPTLGGQATMALSKLTTTPYQVIVGPGAAFEEGRTVTPTDITDNPAQTLLVVEATEPVPWTRPQDLRYSPSGPVPKLGDGQGFMAVFCDGAAQFVYSADEKTLRAQITRSGGEKLEREPSKP